MSTVEVLNPLGTIPASGLPIARRNPIGPGEGIGFLTNGKWNADKLLATFRDKLISKHCLREVIWLDKLEHKGPGQGAPPRFFTQITSSGARAMLVASGD